MKKLEETIQKLREFPFEIFDITRRVVEENQNVIIELNTDDQLLLQGVNRDSVFIADYAPYAELTLRLKKEKKQATDRVTLHDSGDFHNSFTVELTDTTLEIKATDWKTEELTVKYGEEIFGLTDASVNVFAHDYIKSEIIKALRAL